mgnify:CR=1 FL=1|tara:strand:- start:3746 stop:3955 length:210 start_codon:yes stop_codon:yes gene_type:complete
MGKYTKLNKKLTEMRRNNLLESFFDRLKKAIQKISDDRIAQIMKDRDAEIADLVKAFRKNPEKFKKALG